MKSLIAILTALAFASCTTTPREDLHCHHLQHTSAWDIQKSLEREGFVVAADWRGNSIITITSEDDWNRIVGRIRELDVR